MKLTPALVALVLAAWAHSLAPSDARPRSAKQTNAGRHVGVTAPASFAVKGRGTASPVIRPAPALTKKNAIGATVPLAGMGPPVTGPGVIPGGNAAALAKSNPTGAQPGAFAAVAPAPAAAAKIGPGAGSTFVRSAAPALSAHGGGISGTGIARPGTAPGVIGGPAKLAGGVSGTGMKPKR